jgi:EpsI family protein
MTGGASKGRVNARVGFLAAALVIASAAVWQLTPRIARHDVVAPLASLVPIEFAGWREVPLASDAVDPRSRLPGEVDREAPYNDVLMRGYANPRGDVVMLALAYGSHQRQEVKIHRPELCYTAQGFEVLRRTPVDLPLTGVSARPAHGARMLVRGADRVETVTYWIRIGDLYSRGAWKTRSHIFTEGLSGRLVDGILVRASQIVPDAASATPQRFALQEEFLAQLVRALPAGARELLVSDAS